MAEKELQGQNAEPSGRKKGKMKLILIPVVLILLVGIAVGGTRMGFLPIPGLAPKKGGSEKEAKAKQPESSLGITYNMKPFIVNLADESAGRYLKVRFEMELDSEDLVPEIEKRMAQLTDAVIMLLSSKTYKDLASYEGKDRMRHEIILRLNSFLTTGSIRKIYFTEFMMQ